MAPAANSEAIDGITGADKCTDIQEKLGKLCTIIVGISPCGDFRMTNADVRGVQTKTWKDITPALADMYLKYLNRNGNSDWLVYEGQHITWAGGKKLMLALATDLASSFDLKKGDRVGIAMRNYPEFMLAFLGITYMGAVAVPLNAMWKSDELEYAVKDSAMKVMIADPERLELCKPFLGSLGIKSILVRGDAAQAEKLGAAAQWDEVTSRGAAGPPPSYKDVNFEDESMIMYTSGSTGFPKGVVHTQRSVGASLKMGELVKKILPPEEAPKALLAIPMFHITALANVCLWSLPGNSAILMMRKWDAGEALKVIDQEKATRFTGVPTMVRDMLEHPDFSAEKFASMKNIGAGGAPVPPNQVSQMRKKAKGTSSGQGYGLTETMGAVILNSGVDYLKNPTSCGKPIPLMVAAKVKDPATGKVMKDGERGELCIKSHFNMKCYNNRPEDTEKVIDSEGFFHTGDIVKMEGGFVYILDRLKDIIIRGGENIDCSEVERELYKHPAVKEVSVFGLPDERLGEVVGVAVFPLSPVTAEELAQHAAAGKLAKFKVPDVKHFFFLDEELPKGATGKIDKKGLREKYGKLATEQK